jgi:hypothetical protein
MTAQLGDAWCHYLGAWFYAEKERILRGLVGVSVLIALVGCTKTPLPPVAGTRAIYVPEPITVICDRGHLVYQSEKGALQVLPGACPEGKP